MTMHLHQITDLFISFVSVCNEHEIQRFSETETILSQALQHFNNLHLNRLRKQYNIIAVLTELCNETQPTLGTTQPLSLAILSYSDTDV